MILRAPVGTVKEVMTWLKGLQAAGCQRVVDVPVPAVGESSEESAESPAASFGRPAHGGVLIDPRKVNVFLGETQDARLEDSSAAREEGLGV